MPRYISDLELFLALKKKKRVTTQELSEEVDHSYQSVKNGLDRFVEMGLARKVMEGERGKIEYVDTLKLMTGEDIEFIEDVLKSHVRRTTGYLKEELDKIIPFFGDKVGIHPGMQIDKDIFKKIVSAYFDACRQYCEARTKEDPTLCRTTVSYALMLGLKDDILMTCNFYKTK